MKKAEKTKCDEKARELDPFVVRAGDLTGRRRTTKALVKARLDYYDDAGKDA